MRAFATVLLVLTLLAGGVWYYALDGSTPEKTAFSYRLDELRAAADAPESALPTEIRVERIGAAQAPLLFAAGGLRLSPVTLAFTSFNVRGPAGDVIIGAALDRPAFETMGGGAFSDSAYARMNVAMANADQILVTHEHIDHISGVAHYPEPVKIVSKLRMPKEQLSALHEFAPSGRLDPAFDDVQPVDFTTPARVAPGVSALLTPGHTPGHIIVYIKTANSTEHLFVGDIVWLMRNVEEASTRPRFLQDFFFRPHKEDRKAVQAQVRALHNLARAEPDLVILPAHDVAYLNAEIEKGVLQAGFTPRAGTTP